MSTASPIPSPFSAPSRIPINSAARTPVVPQERTWLERIAAWKAGRRAALRGFLRRQVSRDYRAQRRATEDRQKVARRQTLQFNTFAQVPLLNPSRLVASWREILPRVRDAESRRIPFDATGPGIYLVEAVNPPLRAYTIVIVSDVGLVTKTAPGQILVFAAHRTTGAPQRACEVRALVDRRGLEPVQTGEDGTAFLNVGATKPESVLTLARCGADVTISDPGNWAMQAPARELVGYVYTDKPIYRPGHTVRMKGVLRWRTRDRLELFDANEIELAIADANDKVLVRERRPVDVFGTVTTSFTVPAGAALGHYVITVASGDERASGAFEVQEYRKPEFDVTVTSPDRFVLQGGRVQATLTARYYFGQPVAGGSVKYVVHKQPYYSPLRWGDEDSTMADGGAAATSRARRPCASMPRAAPPSRSRWPSTLTAATTRRGSRRVSPTPATARCPVPRSSTPRTAGSW